MLQAASSDVHRLLENPVEDEVHPYRSGDVALRWAVLLAAVESFRQTGYATYGLAVIRHQQDKRWFNSLDRSWPFSFLNICDVIDVEPQAIKKLLFRPDHRP